MGLAKGRLAKPGWKKHLSLGIQKVVLGLPVIWISLSLSHWGK